MIQTEVFSIKGFRVICIHDPPGADYFWVPGVGSFPSYLMAVCVAMSLAEASGEVLELAQAQDLTWFLARAREPGHDGAVELWGFSVLVEGDNLRLPIIGFCAPAAILEKLLFCFMHCEGQELEPQHKQALDAFLAQVRADQSLALPAKVPPAAVVPPNAGAKR